MKAKNCRICGRFADSPFVLCDSCYQKLKLSMPIHLRDSDSGNIYEIRDKKVRRLGAG